MRRKPAAPKTLMKDDHTPLRQTWGKYITEVERQEALGIKHPACRLLMLRFSAEFLRTWEQVKEGLRSPAKREEGEKLPHDLLEQLNRSLKGIHDCATEVILDKEYINSLVFFASVYAWLWDSYTILLELNWESVGKFIFPIMQSLILFQNSEFWSPRFKEQARAHEFFIDMATRVNSIYLREQVSEDQSLDDNLDDINSSVADFYKDRNNPDAKFEVTQQRGMEVFFLGIFQRFTEGLTPEAIKAAFPAWEEQVPQLAEDLASIQRFLKFEFPALVELRRNLAALSTELDAKKQQAEAAALLHAQALAAEEAAEQRRQQIEQARLAKEEAERCARQKEREELRAERRLAKAAARQAEIEDLLMQRQARREECFLAKLSRRLGGPRPMAAQAEPVAPSKTEEFLIQLILEHRFLPYRISQIKKYKKENPALPLAERIYLCHSLSECLRESQAKHFANADARKRELTEFNNWVSALQKELKPFLARPDSQVLASWLRHAVIVESDAKAPAPVPHRKPAEPSLFKPASAPPKEQEIFKLPDGVAELLASFPKVEGYLGIGYLVGGVPRDLLAGQELDEAPDLDILVTGVLPDETYFTKIAPLIASAFAQKISGGVQLRCEAKDVCFKEMRLPGRYNVSVTTAQVTMSGTRLKTYNFQVSFTPRSFEEDAFSRDATCNAIALDRSGRMLAPHAESISDAKNKCYRPIDMERFFDDPVRPLRALKARYIKGFEWQDASFVVKLEGWFNEHFCRASCGQTKEFLDGKQGHFLAKLYELLISVPQEQVEQQSAILAYFVNPDTGLAVVLDLLSDSQRRFLARWPAYSAVIAKMGPSLKDLGVTLAIPAARR